MFARSAASSSNSFFSFVMVDASSVSLNLAVSSSMWATCTVDSSSPTFSRCASNFSWISWSCPALALATCSCAAILSLLRCAARALSRSTSTAALLDDNSYCNSRASWAARCSAAVVAAVAIWRRSCNTRIWSFSILHSLRRSWSSVVATSADRCDSVSDRSNDDFSLIVSDSQACNSWESDADWLCNRFCASCNPCTSSTSVLNFLSRTLACDCNFATMFSAASARCCCSSATSFKCKAACAFSRCNCANSCRNNLACLSTSMLADICTCPRVTSSRSAATRCLSSARLSCSACAACFASRKAAASEVRNACNDSICASKRAASNLVCSRSRRWTTRSCSSLLSTR
mmetsp:Transcript_47356/g.107451  ORF Transcript_47356/g.107451 Transcript_47356/m.107451 type:complete len:347 (-) Transcript_47356:528-1568(-)